MPSTGSSFFERRGVTILAATLFLVPFLAIWGMAAIRSNRNDVKSWLPDDYPETTTFKWYWNHFEGDAFILASWDGCKLGNRKVANIAHALRKESEAEYAQSGFRLFRDVTTGEELLNRLVDEQDLSEEEALERLRGCVIGPDGLQTCILVSIPHEEIEPWNDAFASAEKAKKTIFHAAVNRVYDTAERFGVFRDQIHLGGPPVDNVAIDIEGERSMVMLAGVCAVLGLVLSWYTLRSWRFTLVVSSTAILTAGASLTIVYVVGTPMNAILMTMPALVFVAAASGAIHLSNYYRDAAAHGGVPGAAGRALRHAWLPLALATGTTGIGLASLAISELAPIKSFGLYSAVGVVASFVILCTYTPAVLEVWRPRDAVAKDAPAPSETTLWTTHGVPVAKWILKRHALVTAACLAVLALGIYGTTRVETSVKLMRLFSPKATILKDYAWLESRLGPLVPVEVILRIDPKQSSLTVMEQMQLAERVRHEVAKMPVVGSAMAASTFAPPVPEDAGVARRATWSNELKAKRRLLHDYWCKDKKDGQELWRVSARVGALDNDLNYTALVQDVKAVVEPILNEYRNRGVQGLSAVYTGVIPLVDKAQHSLFDGLLFGFAGDLVLICVAIIAMMRNWSSGPLLMLPSVFPLVFVFGAMGLLGIVVDTGTVMAPAVALGVTVDDAIHFMLWCRRGEDEGLNRRDSILYAFNDCAQPIYQSWAVIGLGLSAFALSAFMPTRRFGLLMLTMLTVSSIGNLVFLPALLMGPAGNWFWRRKSKPEPEATDLYRRRSLIIHRHTTEDVLGVG